MSRRTGETLTDVVELTTQPCENGIAAAFVENIIDPRPVVQIAEETGATIVGTLCSDALCWPQRPSTSYLAMMCDNATTSVQALSS